MKKIYFVRHGESILNAAGKLAGSTESKLTPRGRAQAKAAGQKAKDLGIDYIISSPQSRALQTAQIFAREIGYPKDKIHTNALLAERHFGELEGKDWNPDLNLDGIVDVETVDTLLVRAKLALEFLENVDANCILIVAHGSIGRALRHHLVASHPFTLPGRLQNAEIYQWL